MITILVSILECATYEHHLLKSRLAESLEHLGGLEKFVSKGEKVLLKVNLVMGKRPEEAATTHPAFVRALAEILLDFGCEVLIGDSPGGPFSESRLRSVYKTTGMTEVARETGAQLNFDTTVVSVENPSGFVQKKITLAGFVTGADKVISVGKLKSHCMMKMTGATKNMFGAVPGMLKAQYHFNCPDPSSFADCLIDICAYVAPVLSFVDGIISMEGHGPTAGSPRETGIILASESPYELDLAIAKIIGLPPEHSPFLQRMIERHWCNPHGDTITFAGDSIEKLMVKNFNIPKTNSIYFLGNNPPKLIEKFIKNNLQPQPAIDHNLCVGCGECAALCPAKIISMENHKPAIALNQCIRCFCCQELCPKKAVQIKRPLLLKLLSKS